MSLEFRIAEPDDYAGVIDVMSTAFLERVDVTRAAEMAARDWEPGRTWAAFDDGRPCGTFRSWATELTLPGLRRLPAAAVSGVTVLPTHRRRGILTALAAREHAAARERGEAIALLYASEYPIYGRLGYAPATRQAAWTVDTRRTTMRGQPAGGVELVTPDAGAVEILDPVFDQWRATQPGEIRRRDASWSRRLGLEEEPWGERWKGFLAVRRDAAGTADGYVLYKAESRWVDRMPAMKVEAKEFIAATDEAYAALWRYLLEMDLVTTVVVDGLREHEPLPWLLENARAARATEVGDGLWARLLDVPRALAERAYAGSARVVVEVVDADAVGGRQRLLLETSPDGATCRPTDLSPDLTLPVAALGGAYLGGTRLRDVVLATGADEHRSGAVLELDALLRTPDEPRCSTFF